MPRDTGIEMLRGPGFHFSGQQFGSWRERHKSSHFYQALSGGTMGRTARHIIKAQVHQKVLELFQICNRYAPLFLAKRDSYHEVFQMIEQEWEPYAPLDADEIAYVVREYILAREQYHNTGDNRRSDLSDAVDRFKIKWYKIHELNKKGPKPSNEMTFTIRSEPVAAVADELSNLMLTIPRVEMKMKYEWPTRLNPVELALVKDVRIKDDLFGIDKENGRISFLPTITTHPVVLRRHLCETVLSHECSGANGSFALFMEPIAYLDNATRNHQYLPTQGKSKQYATLPKFIEHAQTVGKHRSQTLSLVTSLDHRTGLVIVLRPLEK